MQKPPTFAPAALLAASAAWTLALAFGEPTIGMAAAAVAAVDLLLVTLVVIVGIMVARARWARRFAWIAIGLMAAISLTMAISNHWMIALALSGLAVTAVSGPSLDRHLSRRTVGGPPPKAVALPLTLVVLPAVTAFAIGSPLSIPAWFMIIGSPVVAWTYGKAFAAGLWAARVGLPVVGVAILWPADRWSMLLLVIALAVELWLAWSKDAALSIRNSESILSAVSIPIPPELAPPEVLSAAGLDGRGRRPDARGPIPKE